MGLFWKILLFPLLFLLGLMALGGIATNTPELVSGMGFGAGATLVYMIAKYLYCKAHGLPFKPRSAYQKIVRFIDKLQHGPRKRAEYRRIYRHYVQDDWEDAESDAMPSKRVGAEKPLP
jgi:hypothetical protein